MDRITRRSVVAAGAVAVAGCSTDDGDGDGYGTGDDGTDSPGDGGADNPALASAERESALVVGSPAFDNGDAIPDRYGRDAADVNPPLELSGVPDAAASLAIVVTDPDAVDVTGEIFVHWLVWNVPTDTTTIPADWTPETAIEGENDFGEVGYGGPAPPDEEHTYRFNCFALDGSLSVEAGSTVSDLGEAMQGRILARAQLDGSYAP